MKDRQYSSTRINSLSTAQNLVDIFGKTDELGAIIGALSGTALASVILYFTTRKRAKRIIQLKKELDKTYNPIQRLQALEIEKLNRELVIADNASQAIGGVVGYIALKPISDRAKNELLGLTIGSKVADKISRGILLGKYHKLDQLKLDYDQSLNYSQKLLQQQLKEEVDKQGLTWTLGIIGAGSLGGIIGNIKHKQLKSQNKT